MTASKVLLIFLISIFSQGIICGQNQLDTISAEKAAQLIGQEVIIKAKIVSVYYSQNSKGKPTFLNLERKYPNNPVAIVIFEQAIEKLKINTDLYLNKTVIVSGKMEAYKDKTPPYKLKPIITIYKKDQIKILEN